ncbi:hypothetical protein [Leisingera sp.]
MPHNEALQMLDALVGLLGKLRLRRDQPTAPGWLRMRRISSQVEEWLLR